MAGLILMVEGQIEMGLCFHLRSHITEFNADFSWSRRCGAGLALRASGGGHLRLTSSNRTGQGMHNRGGRGEEDKFLIVKTRREELRE